MGGSPQDWGVSHRRKKVRIASAMEIIAGKKKMLFHVPKMAMPMVASGAMSPPPRLCETFHHDHHAPRSVWENHVTMVFAYGG